MEAIGQLTGGIAHDFNNLLMVIGGNAALLRDKAEDETVGRRASAIIRAAEQGERLTRQLLAFSRRQMLRPETLNLRDRTREIAEMLSRSLREDIEFGIEFPENLWPVTVDPAEFELALLNIGINARDAMPNGGSFRVTARNISLHSGGSGNEGLAGDFIVLALSDSGGGMTTEVRSRAFEPFFTTKGVGLGTGLGLSQVYGFAKQSGGTALIDSEPGKGTTITLLLPRATMVTAASRPVAGDAVRPPVPARILLVEDDGDVAKVTAELLRDIGSEAVTASDGEAALAEVERNAAIDLVISDIVMPRGMSGIDLARRLREAPSRASRFAGERLQPVRSGDRGGRIYSRREALQPRCVDESDPKGGGPSLEAEASRRTGGFSALIAAPLSCRSEARQWWSRGGSNP